MIGSMWGLVACLSPLTDEPDITPTPIPTPTPTWVTVPTFTPTAHIRLVASAPPGTPEPTPTPQYHTVRQGDTLIGIAYRYGITVEDLRTANRIHNERLLQIDQVLTIPNPDRDRGVRGTPTPLAHAVGQISAAVDGLGIPWIMGSVENRATESVAEVRVVARLLNAANTEVARATSVALRHIVPPGGRTPFMMSVAAGTADWSQWELSVATSLPAYELGYHQELEVVALRFEVVEARMVTVEGEVVNQGRLPAQNVEVVVTVLNNLDRIVGTRVLQLHPATLAPDTTGLFTGTVLALSSDVTSVEAFAQGWQDSGP